MENNYSVLNLEDVKFILNLKKDINDIIGIINTTLNTPYNGIKVRCSDPSQITITFDGGENVGKVPARFASNYYRAMGNGNSGYIAYNLIDGNGAVINSGGSIIISETTTAKTIKLQGRAINDGTPLATGDYTDTISVLISF